MKLTADELDEVVEVPGMRIRAAAPIPVAHRPYKRPEGLAVAEIEPLIEAAEAYFGPTIRELDPVKQALVIAFLKTSNQSRACAMVGVSVLTHMKWLRDDTVYQGIWLAANEAITDLLEETAIHTAVKTRDMRGLVALLKGRRRQVYGTVPPVDDGTRANSWAELTKKLGAEDE